MAILLTILTQKKQFKYQISVMRIKSKALSQAWNPEKDLQSTSHSSKLVAPYSNGETIINYLNLNITNSQLYSPRLQGSRRINYDCRKMISSSNKVSNCSFDHNVQEVHWSYSSPAQSNAMTNSKVIQSVETTVNRNDQGTPRSKPKSYYMEFRKRFINHLSEVDTVESKFMVSATPNQLLQESEIVFKGSRDVGKIMPVKLVYEDYGSEIREVTVKVICLPQPFDLKLIKKSNDQVSLVLQRNSMSSSSLIKIESSYCQEYFTNEGIVQIYLKRKIGAFTFLFAQPYEYTLDQLIRFRKINRDNMAIIFEHIKIPVKTLCEEKSSFFEIQGMEKTIFYVHGKFKLLPIFAKGKIQILKSFETLSEQILHYLHSLLDRK